MSKLPPDIPILTKDILTELFHRLKVHFFTASKQKIVSSIESTSPHFPKTIRKIVDDSLQRLRHKERFRVEVHNFWVTVGNEKVVPEIELEELVIDGECIKKLRNDTSDETPSR